MVVCLDTPIVIWAVRGWATAGQEDMVRRAQHYLNGLVEAKARVLVPAPVICEYMSAVAPPDHETVLATLDKHFFLAPLDARAAALAGEMMYNGDSTYKEHRKSSGKGRNEVRTDVLIIATAIAHKAEKVVTNDLRHFRKLAGARIRVEQLPEVSFQRTLFDVIGESRGGQGGTS